MQDFKGGSKNDYLGFTGCLNLCNQKGMLAFTRKDPVSNQVINQHCPGSKDYKTKQKAKFVYPVSHPEKTHRIADESI